MGWRSTNIAEKLVDYANTTNVEFIVDPKVLFHGWLIYSYLHVHVSWSSDCQRSVQIGSLTTLWHWSYCFHRWYSMSQQENSILINEHVLNHEPIPLSIICAYMFSLRGNDPFREVAVQKYGIQNPETEYGIITYSINDRKIKKFTFHNLSAIQT